MRSFMKTLSKTTLPRIDNDAHPIRRQIFDCLLFAAAALFCMSIAQAAETSAAAASALKVLSAPLDEARSPPAAPLSEGGTRASITVQKGESIDAAIRRGLPGLILNEEFMRQALAKANPRIFPKGRTYPVKPGTVLILPSPEALRQQILLQYPPTAALFQTTAEQPETSDAYPGPDKRRWVRFP